ncbi:hypothetical protein [Thiocapsa sp.]|uniref:hypothetical protein n=1 Tax=Thiocapsa sp. TaxID=2024551 RepID=UPI0035948C26
MTNRIAGPAVFALAAALSGPAPAQTDDAPSAKLQTMADACILYPCREGVEKVTGRRVQEPFD